MANKSAIAVAGTMLGVTFVWSGIRGASVTKTLQEILTGTKPKGTDIYPTGLSSSAGSNQSTSQISGMAGGSETGNVIESDALQYRGYPYVWGGSSPQGFDCSGLVNQVIGRDLRMSIPGYPSGQYSGHGPVTGQWFAWSGAVTIPGSQMQAGDLVCWITHMGIAISSSNIISAQDPAIGVAVSTVQGASPGPEPLRIRRLKALAQSAGPGNAKLGTL